MKIALTKPAMGWAILLLSLMSFRTAAGATGKPDTIALLNGAEQFAHVYKIEDLSSGSIGYEIDLCTPDDGCEYIKTDGDKLQELADYTYLYVIYKGFRYQRTVESAATLAKDARSKGLNQSVLDFYHKRLHCQKDDNQAQCVMVGLMKSAGVKFYSESFDEGQTSYTLDDE